MYVSLAFLHNINFMLNIYLDIYDNHHQHSYNLKVFAFKTSNKIKNKNSLYIHKQYENLSTS